MIPTSNLANVNDMDFLNPSFYDAKFVRTSTGHGFNLDLLEPGFYNAKLARVSSVWESYGVDLYENVAKVIRTNNGMDIGLLGPGFCNANWLTLTAASRGSRKTTSSTAKIIMPRLLPRPR